MFISGFWKTLGIIMMQLMNDNDSDIPLAS